MTHHVYDIVGELAITADGGQALYDLIYPELTEDRSVELDFTGVRVFASPFFNFAIGQLLQDLPSDKLNRLVHITALSDSGRTLLERIIANAKEYYSNAEHRAAVDTVLEEQAANF